ncbi:E3 SUMO-protein ligase RanBP2 [Kickxella alabastrina]|nr:E3 SUMO-protein ligase RanBP2 [Kickxella alabastrina]
MPTLKDGEWKCTVCDIKNKDVSKCAACESPKPAPASAAAPAITSAAPAPAAAPNLWAQSGFKMPTLKDGEWKCTVCDIKNKDVSKCAACESPKPASESAAASAITSAAPALAAVQSSVDLAKQNAGSVDVSQLPVFSFDLDVLKKPAAPFAPAAVPNMWAQSGFKMPALKDGEWKCSTCLVSNASSAKQCAACETPK